MRTTWILHGTFRVLSIGSTLRSWPGMTSSRLSSFLASCFFGSWAATRLALVATRRIARRRQQSRFMNALPKKGARAGGGDAAPIVVGFFGRDKPVLASSPEIKHKCGYRTHQEDEAAGRTDRQRPIMSVMFNC